MKRANRALIAFCLTLACGTVVGIGLQKYFDLSAQVANGLRKAGLYQYAYGPAAALKNRTSQPTTVPEPLQGKLKLYVLVGQSNMVGVADVPDGLAASANIFTFGNDYQWKLATEPVDDPTGQIDLISEDEEFGFGPAFTFAKTLVEQNSNQFIGLIPCARSGSSITDWQKSLSDQSLYGSCLKRVRAASTMGTVSGILFFQGEADTIDPQQYPSLRPDAGAWAEKFASFAYNFRNDLGNPDLPMVYAQLGQPEDLEGLPNWPLVQQQQENIQIPNATMIKTNDLPMDGIHFTTDSYQVIGQRFADAIATLTSPAAEAFDNSIPNPNAESAPAESAQ
ncbi:MAG: sialate O-acetylesterase [Phormidesmis sp.]